MLQFGDSPLEFFVLRLQLRYRHLVHESLLQLILACSRQILSDCFFEKSYSGLRNRIQESELPLPCAQGQESRG
jgi:hypothetical protein